MENKVLGKGLSALITKNPSSLTESSSLEIKSDMVMRLKTNSILENQFQPRKHYDESTLEELKASIKESGILQPLLVRKHGEKYEIVAGERRLKAAKAIGLEEVPVIIKNVTDKEAFVLALVENIQREELNAIEEALGFKRLVDEFQFTQEDVAKAVGKDRSTVTNLLRLLRLPEEIQKQVAQAQLSMGHARALLSLEGAALQKKMAQVVIEKGLSVRQVEELVNKVHHGQNITQAAKAKSKNRDIEILEEELQKILGTKVIVKDKKGKGKITVEYYSLDDLDRILGILRK
jgi:ParB family chromosome partitioning protein